MPEVAQPLEFFHRSDDGQLFVNVADLVLFLHHVAAKLQADGEEDKAAGVASIGLVLANTMGPDPEMN